MLKTKRLVLRTFNNNDINDFHDIFSQDKVVKYLPFDALSHAQARNKLDKIVNEMSDVNKKPIKFILAVKHEKDEKVIGWVGCGPIPFDKEKAEIFYALNSNYWGKGIAYEAANKVLQFLLNKKELDNIYALVDKENKGSVKILKKLKFKPLTKIDSVGNEFEFFKGLMLYKYNK